MHKATASILKIKIINKNKDGLDFEMCRRCFALQMFYRAAWNADAV